MRRLFTVIILLLGCLSYKADAQLNKYYYYYVGHNYIVDSKYQDAIEVLNTLLRFDDTAYEGYFLRGIAKFNLRDLMGAESDMTSAIELNPVYTMAYYYRAITRSQLGRYDAALEDYKEALDLRPDQLDTYFNRGITYLLAEQYENAVNDFSFYLRRDSRSVNSYINRGISYANLRDTVSALNDFGKAIELNPYQPEPYSRRALIYIERGDSDMALADLSKAIDLDPAHLISYFNRGLLYSEQNKPVEAIADFDKIISLDSTMSQAYFNRAILRGQIGDYNRAVDDYNRASLLTPENVIIYFNRAHLNAQLGNYIAAQNDFSKAIDLFPDFAKAYQGRASVRYYLHDSEGYANDVRKADAIIADYRSRIKDDAFLSLADTSRNFNRLLSFDAKSEVSAGSSRGANTPALALLPMFRYSFMQEKKGMQPIPVYIVAAAGEMIRSVGNPRLQLVNTESDLPTDTIMAIDNRFSQNIYKGDVTWQDLFQKGVSQTLMKQYTGALNSYTAAIDVDPSNPFLYFNRSSAQSEMTDFISSIDNNYQQYTLNGNVPGQSTVTRIYNYDSAIVDLNKAAKLLPDFAYIYYNRGMLYYKSGMMEDAVNDYSRAIELNPYFAEAYYNRGILHIVMNDTRSGIADLSKAGELGVAGAYNIIKLYSNER